jgi:L-lactate dehydrogenase complex protein LldF
VKINIPEILIHLRGRVVEEDQKTLSGRLSAESVAMHGAAVAFQSQTRYEAAQRLARTGQLLFKRGDELKHLPGMAGEWTRFRDLRAIPAHSFRDWWKARARREAKP